jgi:predicted dehydrogenase
MSRIRIAVVGAGLIGRHHIQVIRNSGSCELSAIADPALGAADFTREARVPTYPILTDMLDAERPDGVIVATPNSLARQLEHFCSVIRGETEPLVTGREGLQTLRVTLAIHEAARTESSVHLPLAENTGATMDKESS